MEHQNECCMPITEIRKFYVNVILDIPWEKTVTIII